MERAGVPGQCSGIVRKVHSFEEVDAVGEGCVLLFARSMQSNVRNTPTLFAALLRVKGIVAVNGPMMWMHHLAQVACECGVLVVQILPIDQVVDPLQRPAVSYITASRSGNCSFTGFHRSSTDSH